MPPKSSKLLSLISKHQFVLTVVAVWVVWFYIYYFSTRFTKIIRVKKHFGYQSGGRRRAVSNMVVDEHNQPYKIKNSMFLFKFDAAENIAKMEENQQYRVHGYGIYLPALGIYPVIVQVN